jgi:hypothetical protein
MDKIAPRLEVNPNAFLLYQRPGLLDAAVEGVSDVMTLQGYEPNVEVCTIEDAAKTTTGLEFFVQHYHGQDHIGAREYLHMQEAKTELFAQSADRFIALTTQGLTLENGEYVLGATTPDLRFSVMSLASVLQSGINYGAQSKVIKHLAGRQYAMLEGLPFDSDTGDNLIHSSDDCALSHVTTLSETLRLAEKSAGSSTAGFCAICLAKLRQAAISKA